MSLDAAAALFKEEASELLADLEQMLLELEGDPSNAECIAKVFRDIHTIKGSGAMFGYSELARFAHDVETVFDKVRSGQISLDKDLLGLTLTAKDHIAKLLASPEALAEDIETSDSILAFLKPYLGERTEAAADQSAEKKPLGGPVSVEVANAKTFLMRYRPAANTFFTGTDPFRLMCELAALGRMWCVFRPEAIPPLERLDPSSGYAWWDILLISDKGLNTIRDVFIFVEDDGGFEVDEIRPEAIRGSDVPVLLKMIEGGADKGFAGLRDEIGAWIAGKVSQRKTVKPQVQAEPASAASIRVDSARLDQLVNLVGELVIVQSRLSQAVRDSQAANLRSIAEDLQRLCSEMRDSTLGIRMVPIGSIYGTLRRLVRDLCQDMAKDAVFTGQGAQTELDKNVIDQLKDPLVHILRNSIDHGIEDPKTRLELGKPEKGEIVLDAVHSGGSILITISDDGKGIDPQKLREKAVEKGLIQAGDALSEKEILNLVFAPGFSTAQKVTNVSGRGVGMDVVKKNIENLRGSVDIESVPGQGCKLSIRLPLTLAIIDGLQVRVGREYFVLPLAAIEACQERFVEEPLEAVAAMDYKGDLIPCASLRKILGVPGEQPRYERIVVTSVEGRYVGLAVDAVIGQQQAVIKPLSEALGGIRFISGTTVNGDGGISVILDVPYLVGFANDTVQKAKQARVPVSG